VDALLGPGKEPANLGEVHGRGALLGPGMAGRPAHVRGGDSVRG
jgi:hypothetical protein